jgi:hypothetical protein
MHVSTLKLEHTNTTQSACAMSGDGSGLFVSGDDSGSSVREDDTIVKDASAPSYANADSVLITEPGQEPGQFQEELKVKSKGKQKKTKRMQIRSPCRANGDGLQEEFEQPRHKGRANRRRSWSGASMKDLEIQAPLKTIMVDGQNSYLPDEPEQKISNQDVKRTLLMAKHVRTGAAKARRRTTDNVATMIAQDEKDQLALSYMFQSPINEAIMSALHDEPTVSTAQGEEQITTDMDHLASNYIVDAQLPEEVEPSKVKPPRRKKRTYRRSSLEEQSVRRRSRSLDAQNDPVDAQDEPFVSITHHEKDRLASFYMFQSSSNGATMSALQDEPAVSTAQEEEHITTDMDYLASNCIVDAQLPVEIKPPRRKGRANRRSSWSGVFISELEIQSPLKAIMVDGQNDSMVGAQLPEEIKPPRRKGRFNSRRSWSEASMSKFEVQSPLKTILADGQNDSMVCAQLQETFESPRRKGRSNSRRSWSGVSMSELEMQSPLKTIMVDPDFKRTLLMVKHVRTGAAKSQTRFSWDASTTDFLEESPGSLDQDGQLKHVRTGAAKARTRFSWNASTTDSLEESLDSPDQNRQPQHLISEVFSSRKSRVNADAEENYYQPEEVDHVSEMERSSTPQNFVMDLNDPNKSWRATGAPVGPREISSSCSTRLWMMGRDKKSHRSHSPDLIVVSSANMPSHIDQPTLSSGEQGITCLQLTAFGETTTVRYDVYSPDLGVVSSPNIPSHIDRPSLSAGEQGITCLQLTAFGETTIIGYEVQ